MLNLYFRICSWLEREEGQDLIEYALLAFLISVFAIAVLRLIGPQIVLVFEAIVDALT